MMGSGRWFQRKDDISWPVTFKCIGVSEVQSWIVSDGDIDPEWIESLNSVLDDNRLLTMPSGERIQFGPNVNFLFETHDLSCASPATISRMGMIFLRWSAMFVCFVFVFDLPEVIYSVVCVASVFDLLEVIYSVCVCCLRVWSSWGDLQCLCVLSLCLIFLRWSTVFVCVVFVFDLLEVICSVCVVVFVFDLLEVICSVCVCCLCVLSSWCDLQHLCVLSLWVFVLNILVCSSEFVLFCPIFASVFRHCVLSLWLYELIFVFVEMSPFSL